MKTTASGAAPARVGPPRAATWRRFLLVVAPVGWVIAALLHPAPDVTTLYEDLAAAADRWLGVHLLQMVLTVGMGATMWALVRGRTGIAAAMTRAAIPTYLVFFTAFDAVAGVASGLAVRHAATLDGAERIGAASTAEYMLRNQIAGELSPVAAISSLALVAAVIGLAMTLRGVGARRPIWIGALGAILLNVHAAGPVPAVGVIAFAVAVHLADRDGLVLRRADALGDAI